MAISKEPETIITKKPDGRSNPSAEKLEKLKLARERAYAIRAEQRELKEKEQLVKSLEKQKRNEEVEKKLKELGVKESKPEPEDMEPPKPKSIPKPKKKIILEESSSDDEPEIVFRRVRRQPPVQPVQPVQQFNNDTLSQAAIHDEMKRLRREMAKKSLFSSFKN